MSTIKAIIVEDEPSGMKNLKWKLETYCPDIEVIADCPTAEKAIESIKRFRPDVVFLDIRLGKLTGFDVLEAIPFTNFEVIITTDYDEYAIKAIKKQALDYLTKPIRKTELEAAVQKLIERKDRTLFSPRRIALPISSGSKYVEVDDILYIEAQNTRSRVTLFSVHESNAKVSEPIVLTCVLKDMELQLRRFGFCKPNQSFLINLSHIMEYIRKDGGWAVMRNGKPINITNSYREQFHICRNNWFG